MNRLKGFKVYQIGPMDDVKDRGVGWREDLTPFLNSLGVSVFNPCDKPTKHAVEVGDAYNKRRELLEIAKTLSSPYQISEIFNEVTKIMKPIVSYDLRMVDLSDFVIMYIDRNAHMCGSYCEVSHAFIQRKPVIVMCEQGIYNVPDWLFGHGKHEMFFDSWEGVKKYLLHINNDILVDDLNRWKFFDYDKIKG